MGTGDERHQGPGSRAVGRAARLRAQEGDGVRVVPPGSPGAAAAAATLAESLEPCCQPRDPGPGPGAEESREEVLSPQSALREGALPAPAASPARSAQSAGRSPPPVTSSSPRPGPPGAPSPGPPPNTKLAGAYKSRRRRDPRTHGAGAGAASARPAPTPALPTPAARPWPITGDTASTTVSAGGGRRGGGGAWGPDLGRALAPAPQRPHLLFTAAAGAPEAACAPRPPRALLPGAARPPPPAPRPLSRNPRVRRRRAGPRAGERSLTPGARARGYLNRT